MNNIENLSDPFVSSLNNVISMFTGSTARETGIEHMKTRLETGDHNVHVFLGVNGDLYGNVIFSTQRENALKIASLMSGMELTDFDSMSISALQELLNITSGGALTQFAEAGLKADITPPTFLSGEKINMDVSYPLTSINMEVTGIQFKLNLSLNRRKVKNILIVDDSAFMRRVNYDYVIQNGYQVIGECTNGVECMAFLEKQQPDIIMLDINMPELDGLSTLELVKKKYPGIKVAMVTSLGESQNVKRAVALGADAYVLKPIHENNLLVALRKL